MPPDFIAHNRNRVIILADVNALHWNLFRDLGVIVHDQRNGRSTCNFVKLGAKIDQFVDRFMFSAQLNKIDTSFDQLFGHAHGLGRVDVIEIDDPIEPAISKRFHRGRNWL